MKGWPQENIDLGFYNVFREHNRKKKDRNYSSPLFSSHLLNSSMQVHFAFLHLQL